MRVRAADGDRSLENQFLHRAQATPLRRSFALLARLPHEHWMKYQNFGVVLKLIPKPGPLNPKASTLNLAALGFRA